MNPTAPLEAVFASTRQVMANIQADQMQEATPCASWNVGEVINHVIGAQDFWVAGMTGTPPSGESQNWAEGDYLAAYDQATSAALAAFQEDGALQKMVALPFGEMPGGAVMGLAMNDTFTHGWDLAKATGQDTNLAPEIAQAILGQAQQNIQEGFRGEDGQAPFGQAQDCPEGACAADQLAAFLGRQV